MVARIGHEEVRRLLDEGAQIVDVLPREEYDEFHLSGAISLPLKELHKNSARLLDKERPIIVYCNDNI